MPNTSTSADSVEHLRQAVLDMRDLGRDFPIVLDTADHSRSFTAGDLRELLRLLDQRAEVQRGTVAALEEESIPSMQWTVMADASDVYATTMCEDDTAHGLATVVFPINSDSSPGQELCPACALRVVGFSAEPETTLELTVLR